MGFIDQCKGATEHLYTIVGMPAAWGAIQKGAYLKQSHTPPPPLLPSLSCITSCCVEWCPKPSSQAFLGGQRGFHGKGMIGRSPDARVALVMQPFGSRLGDLSQVSIFGVSQALFSTQVTCPVVYQVTSKQVNQSQREKTMTLLFSKIPWDTRWCHPCVAR